MLLPHHRIQIIRSRLQYMECAHRVMIGVEHLPEAKRVAGQRYVLNQSEIMDELAHLEAIGALQFIAHLLEQDHLSIENSKGLAV